MSIIIKTFGTQYFTYLEIGILFYHECTQYGLFEFNGLGLYVGIIFGERALGLGIAVGSSCVVGWYVHGSS